MARKKDKKNQKDKKAQKAQKEAKATSPQGVPAKAEAAVVESTSRKAKKNQK